MNHDGLGYFHRLSEGRLDHALFPGHLAYGPLLLVAWHLVSALVPVDLARFMWAASNLAAAATISVTWQTAGYWGARGTGRALAAAGLAVSYGFWLAAADVETYSLALLGVAVSLHQMARYWEAPTSKRLVALACANIASALMNLNLVLTALASAGVVVAARRGDSRRTARSLVLFSMMVVVGIGLPYVAAIRFLGLASPGEALGWVAGAKHGLPTWFDAWSLPRALYGFLRSFIFLEFYGIASRLVVAAKFVGLGALWTVVAVATWRSWRRLPACARASLIAMTPFVLGLTVLGVFWYPSEVERWVFFLPLLWLLSGAVVDTARPVWRVAGSGAVAAIFLLNLFQGILPLRADSLVKERVLALAGEVQANTWVLTPGNDWLAYYQLYTGRPIKVVELIELATRHPDRATFFRDLEQMLRGHLEAGGTVLMIRILDPAEDSRTTPWQELAHLGYPFDWVRSCVALFPWSSLTLADPGRTRIYELSPQSVWRPISGAAGCQLASDTQPD